MKHSYIKCIGTLVMACWSVAQAAPYSGNAPACTPTSTPQTCKIDLTDFMKSQFNWTIGGKTYTSDSTNLSAAANSASTSSFRFIRKEGNSIYDYDSNTLKFGTADVTVKQGFMNHPSLPNVLLHSKTGTNTGGTLEVFRWAAGLDNAMYVQSEPYDNGGWKSFAQRESAPNMQWINRGYFWSDKLFDVVKNPANPAEWVSATRTWSGSDHDDILPSGAKTGTTLIGSTNSVVVRYYPAENGAWVNAGLGQLPSTPLEILEVVLRKEVGSAVTWWEKFDYARQKRADGSYNYFGMIRFQSSFDYYSHPYAKCTNGVPPAGHANGECGDADLLIEITSHYNAFTNALDAQQGKTVKAWYDTALLPAYKPQNDPKLTLRSTPGDLTLPHNRGGFIPPGSGADAKGVSFGGSSTAPPGQMLYLENTTVEQDWYIYPNGQDPLYAPAASPTNYCREGYSYLASFTTTESYNGLNGASTKGLHWVIVCGTSTDAYFQGSNGAQEASCNPGYISRGWFGKPTNLSMTTCLPGGSCVDATAKPYINLCVSQKETAFTYPAPNP
ncbi:hypothetical protein [Duganella sp. Dugasp56]|uniref:hypothetical protein n=1 Tax=Duganella sp. Dugasp56 TaxID=3243046 RepID=UPI0039AFB336